MLRNLLHNWMTGGTTQAPRASQRFRPGFETLEDRSLMSASPFNETLVATIDPPPIAGPVLLNPPVADNVQAPVQMPQVIWTDLANAKPPAPAPAAEGDLLAQLPSTQRKMTDNRLGTGLAPQAGQIQQTANAAQTEATVRTIYAPPRGAAIEGKKWTLNLGFNSTYLGKRLEPGQLFAKIYWYYSKPAGAAVTGKVVEDGKIVKVQDGILKVTGEHTYTDDGIHNIRVDIYIKNHPRYSRTPWKYATPRLTVWEAPAQVVVLPPLQGQNMIPLRGRIVEFVSEDPTPKQGEFDAVVAVPPGVWAGPFKTKVTQEGNRIRVELEQGTPLIREGVLDINVSLVKRALDGPRKGQIVQYLGQHVAAKVIVERMPLTWPARHAALANRGLLPPGSVADPNGLMNGALAIVLGTYPGSFDYCHVFAIPGGEALLHWYSHLARTQGTAQPQRVGDIGIIFGSLGNPIHSFIVVGQAADGRWLYAQRNGKSLVFISDDSHIHQLANNLADRIRFVRE